jgi:hypothetical protein
MSELTMRDDGLYVFEEGRNGKRPHKNNFTFSRCTWLQTWGRQSWRLNA